MEVEFKPYNKLSFQSYLPYDSVEAFIEVIASANPAGVPFQVRFFWANGVLFRFFNHPRSEALAKEIINGHMIFDHIEYAPMPKYEKEIKMPQRPMGNVVVLDVSKHNIFAPLTAWIRDNLIKK
jgi:hypothetical protein